MAISTKDVKVLQELIPDFIEYLAHNSCFNLADKKSGFKGEPLKELSDDDYDWILRMNSMWSFLSSKNQTMKNSVTSYLEALENVKESIDI